MKHASIRMLAALTACHATPDTLFVDIAAAYAVDVFDLMEIWDEHLKRERARNASTPIAPPPAVQRMAAHA